MNWKDALNSMLLKDKMVRRKSKLKKEFFDGSTNDATGAIKLAYAWTHDDRAVRVFVSVETGHFIVPDVEDMQAKDWEIVNNEGGRLVTT